MALKLRDRYARILTVVAAIFLLTARAGLAQANVLTAHNDAARTGANAAETVLTTSNVNAGQFGRLWRRAVDGQILAQPLFVSQLDFGAQGTHDAVFVATAHNTVYAFDAGSADATPLWQVTLGPSVPAGAGQPLSGADGSPEVGVTGTPVIDLTTGTLYVVAQTYENGVAHQRLHALALTTGAEMAGSPVEIAGTCGSQTFDPLAQYQRAALLLNQGRLTVAFTTHAGASPAHGWVFSYDPSSLSSPPLVYCATPNLQGGGVGQTSGPAGDAFGSVFLTTGAGDNDLMQNGSDLSESVLAFSAPLYLADIFTPGNLATLQANGLDMGTGGLLLLPDLGNGTPPLLVAAGRQGRIYVLNRTNLGYCDPSDSGVFQELDALNGGSFGTPTLWTGPSGNVLYFAAGGDGLTSFTVTGSTAPLTLLARGSETFGPAGATASVSCNGLTAGTGIVWTVDAGAAALRASDAADITRTLYDSATVASGRDSLGTVPAGAVPTIANGQVFVGATDSLVCYGLLPALPPVTAAPMLDHFIVVGSPVVEAGMLAPFAIMAVDKNGVLLPITARVSLAMQTQHGEWRALGALAFRNRSAALFWHRFGRASDCVLKADDGAGHTGVFAFRVVRGCDGLASFRVRVCPADSAGNVTVTATALNHQGRQSALHETARLQIAGPDGTLLTGLPGLQFRHTRSAHVTVRVAPPGPHVFIVSDGRRIGIAVQN